MKTNKLKKRVFTIIALVFISGYFVSCSQEELSEDYKNDVELVVEEDAPVNASKNSCSNIDKLSISNLKDTRYGYQGYFSKLTFKLKNNSSKDLNINDITFKSRYEGASPYGPTLIIVNKRVTIKGKGTLKKGKSISLTVDNGNVERTTLKDLDLVDNSTGCDTDLK